MKAWAKRVILFGIDGAGTFFEQADTPHMDRIFKNGAVSRRTLTELPSISAECWGSMLHGVDCRWHGLTNWATGRRPFPVDSPYPSVFRVIREQRPEAELASFCDWNNINLGIIEDGLDVYKYHAKDADLVQPAVDYIGTHDFTLMFFHFDSVDDAGHAHGYGSPEHLNAISRNDGYIGAIVKAVEKRGWLEDTLLLVEADHGGTPPDARGRGNHGGDTDAEKYVCFFAAGGGARHAELRDMIVRDTAAVILHALGIAIPESWNSRVPGGLFPDVPDNLPRPRGLPPAVPAPSPKPETGRFAERFGELEPLLYLSFETMDALPEGTLRQGKLYLSDGVRGHGMRFDDGWLSMPCPLDGETFSITGWVRLNAMGNRMPVACIRRAESSDSWFSVVANHEDHLILAVRVLGAEKPKNMEIGMPPRPEGTWTFFSAFFDAETGTTGFSLNFEPFLRQQMAGNRLLPEGTSPLLLLGTDVLAGPEERLPGVLDDLCVYRRQLTDEDLIRLKAYYME